MTAQVRRDAVVAIEKAGYALPRRERRREVQVQAGVDSGIERQRRSAIRILHEDHRADGGYGAALDTIENASGRLRVLAPVVSVHDEAAARTRFGIARAARLHPRENAHHQRAWSAWRVWRRSARA